MGERIKVNVLGEHTPLKSAEPGQAFAVVSNNEPWCDLVLEARGPSVVLDSDMPRRIAALTAERDQLRARVAELEAWQRTATEELASERKFWRERGRAEERADVVATIAARRSEFRDRASTNDSGYYDALAGAVDALLVTIERGDHVAAKGPREGGTP
jgi:hypothetical protein